MREEPDLVQVMITQGWDVAQIYKSKLEAAEIPVLLKYEALGPIIGITYDGLGAVHILVPREYLDEARELLEESDLLLDDLLGLLDESDPLPADDSEPDESSSIPNP